MKDGDRTEVPVVPMREKWGSHTVSTGVWALLDAIWG